LAGTLRRLITNRPERTTAAESRLPEVRRQPMDPARPAISSPGRVRGHAGHRPAALAVPGLRQGDDRLRRPGGASPPVREGVIVAGLRRRQAGETLERAAASCTADGQLDPSTLKRWSRCFHLDDGDLVAVPPPVTHFSRSPADAILGAPARSRSPKPSHGGPMGTQSAAALTYLRGASPVKPMVASRLHRPGSRRAPPTTS
jgi:hypothetical protein